MIEIKQKFTGNVLHRLDTDTLRSADLSDRDLREAKLPEADLSNANLSNVNLSNANLAGANLYNTNLTGANLSGANLSFVNLSFADLSFVNLDGAIIAATIFSFCRSLTRVKGLDGIRHLGPSSLDRETLQSFIEDLPDVFLLGVGYTEEEITALRDLYSKAKPIQFYSCFISYSHKDEEFAKRLHAQMRQAGLRVWYAPEDMQGGKKLHEQINQAIQVHDRLLLVLSEHSLGSEWVATEIRRVRKAEREQNRRKLFPIRLLPFDPAIKEWECFDADSGKDLGVELREYFIPDFEHWKDHDQFEAGFARLLRDLKAEEKTG